MLFQRLKTQFTWLCQLQGCWHLLGKCFDWWTQPSRRRASAEEAILQEEAERRWCRWVRCSMRKGTVKGSKMGKEEMRLGGGKKEYAQVQGVPEYLCVCQLWYTPFHTFSIWKWCFVMFLYTVLSLQIQQIWLMTQWFCPIDLSHHLAEILRGSKLINMGQKNVQNLFLLFL